MSTKQLRHVYLETDIGGEDFACQVFKLKYTPPGRQQGKAEYPACPPVSGVDEVVLTPGAPQEGTAAFELWHDTTATGITTSLIEAQQSGATVTYTFVWRFDDPAADYQWTGQATVNPIELPWDKTDETTHRGPVGLKILTGVFGRPPAQPPGE